MVVSSTSIGQGRRSLVSEASEKDILNQGNSIAYCITLAVRNERSNLLSETASPTSLAYRVVLFMDGDFLAPWNDCSDHIEHVVKLSHIPCYINLRFHLSDELFFSPGACRLNLSLTLFYHSAVSFVWGSRPCSWIRSRMLWHTVFYHRVVRFIRQNFVPGVRHVALQHTAFYHYAVSFI